VVHLRIGEHLIHLIDLVATLPRRIAASKTGRGNGKAPDPASARYGDSYERGRDKFDTIMTLVPKLVADKDGGKTLDALRIAAGQDERGDVLKRAIASQFS
jgi:hypothetical protein